MPLDTTKLRLATDAFQAVGERAIAMPTRMAAPVAIAFTPPQPTVQPAQPVIPVDPEAAVRAALQQRFSELGLQQTIDDAELAKFAYEQVRKRLGGQYNGYTERRVQTLQLGTVSKQDDDRSPGKPKEPKPVTVANLEFEVVRDSLQTWLKERLGLRGFPDALKPPTATAANEIIRAARAGGDWNQEVHLARANDKLDQLAELHQHAGTSNPSPTGQQPTSSRPTPNGRHNDEIDHVIAEAVASIFSNPADPAMTDPELVRHLREQWSVADGTGVVEHDTIRQRSKDNFRRIWSERTQALAAKLNLGEVNQLPGDQAKMLGVFTTEHLLQSFTPDVELTTKIEEAIASGKLPATVTA